MTAAAPSTVRYTAHCPACLRECEWQATASPLVYRIFCDCDQAPRPGGAE